MRVLITNHALASRAGTEVYCRDLAHALRSRGHEAVLFSPRCGPFADALRAEGLEVVDRLGSDLEAPDVIHGQHHLATMAAVARFRATPAVFVCHGAVPWEETPPRHPRIVRYVAVDEPCRERLESAEVGAPIEVIPNFVDLSRFRRRPPLPKVPRRALVFSNSAQPSWTRVIAEACAARNIALDVVGIGAGRASDRPEDVLSACDLVFAKARSALEAVATGCAVIVCDRAGLGHMATADAWPRLRQLNLGFRLLSRPHDVAAVSAEIDRYDPADAGRLTEIVRRDASLDDIVQRWIALYEGIHSMGRVSDGTRDALAASEYLAWLGEGFHEQIAQLQVSLAGAHKELSAIQTTRVWRLRNRVLSLPGIQPLYGRLRGRRSIS